MRWLYLRWGHLMARLIVDPAFAAAADEMRQSALLNDGRLGAAEVAPIEGILDTKIAKGCIAAAADSGQGGRSA